MKKIAVLFVVIIAFTLLAHLSFAQIRNGSFEDWTDWMGVDPDWWASFDNYYAGLDAVAISDDAYHGEIAAKLEVLYSDYYGIFPPYLYSWEDGIGHLVSERYEYVTGHYKFFPQNPDDRLFIEVLMLIAYTPVGAGTLFVDSSSTYKSFHVPIIYPGPETPNNVTVAFTITGPGYDPPTVGSWGLVDSVSIGPVATAVESEVISQPKTFSLSQNYPNPFNPVTRIDFTLAEETDTKLEIYNVRGQRVRTLVDHHLEAGAHFVHWDSRDMNGQPVAAGIYFCRLQAGQKTLTRKMFLLK